MELVELNAKVREFTGKGVARRLRKSKQVPAILYGPKTEPVKLSVDTIEFDRIIRENGTSGLFFDLKIDDNSGASRTAMLKDFQTDIYGLEYLHVDFHEIDLDTKVNVTVPIEATGVCKGVKEGGGVLQLIRRELDILCKPADTPETIQVDTTNIDLGDSIHVEDLDLGEKIEIPHDVNFTILTVALPSSSDGEVSEEDEYDSEVAAQTGSENTSEN